MGNKAKWSSLANEHALVTVASKCRVTKQHRQLVTSCFVLFTLCDIFIQLCSSADSYRSFVASACGPSAFTACKYTNSLTTIRKAYTCISYLIGVYFSLDQSVLAAFLLIMEYPRSGRAPPLTSSSNPRPYQHLVVKVMIRLGGLYTDYFSRFFFYSM